VDTDGDGRTANVLCGRHGPQAAKHHSKKETADPSDA
jgi:hypothetical protein